MPVWCAPTRVVAIAALSFAAALVATPASSLAGQAAVPTVSTSFGVDTAIPQVGAIVRLMRAYLARPDSAGRRSNLWSTRDPLDSRSGDVTWPLAYQEAPATILGVNGTDDGDSLYVVKTAYARTDSCGPAVRPIALQRIYAVREGREWRLSNALQRLTRDWQQLRAGRITYWYEPGQHPHPAAVRRAGRFVDSVAALFGVQPPEALDYYVTSSADVYHRIIGLDFFVTASGPGTEHGGLTLPFAGIVLSGNPALGDGYLHELVHAVLGPSWTQNDVVSEGIATWLGGAQGRSYHDMLVLLRRYQADHPSLSLAELIRGVPSAGSDQARSDALKGTGALFAETVYRTRGLAALRALKDATAGEEATLAIMRQDLPDHAEDLDAWWRAATIESSR